MRKKACRQQGFTLIEVLVVLILAGMVAVFAGMGIARVIEGFFFTKLNAETTMKGQMAMTRLVKEFTTITSVSSGTATSIHFTSYRQGSPGNHVVTLTGTDVTLDGDILTNQVSAFDLGYYDGYSGVKQAVWSASTQMIEITLRLKGADDIISVFTDRVVPRNL
jgi:prepilin-type N-terminal cleavage/methylation domain-containing protein